MKLRSEENVQEFRTRLLNLYLERKLLLLARFFERRFCPLIHCGGLKKTRFGQQRQQHPFLYHFGGKGENFSFWFPVKNVI